MMTIAALTARLRLDLRDPDEARWSDDALERHIAHALSDLSIATPREAQDAAEVTQGTRTIDLSALGEVLDVQAIEYPAGEWPPALVPFSTWGSTATLGIPSAPAAAGTMATVSYLAAHTVEDLDGADATTLNAPALDTLLLGAAGYAAVEWASYAINRINAGGPAAARDYETWGRARLVAFRAALVRAGRRVKSGTLQGEGLNPAPGI